jgi:predicted transcriptional regulator
MSIELPAAVEKELQDLAETQRRDLRDLVEEAVRLYLEAAAITDLTVEEVGETQLALAGELRGISEWKDGHA